MSRYRPPRPPSSVYITRKGKEDMEQEYDYLWFKKRPKITITVREAAAQGDRSENAEYIYGKKQLREIDSRLRFLKKRLDVVEVVDQIPDDKNKIFFGAKVSIEDEKGLIQKYQIVGADEFDIKQGTISIDSPLSKALIGKSVGDDIIFKGPVSILEYYVEAVEYKNY